MKTVIQYWETVTIYLHLISRSPTCSDCKRIRETWVTCSGVPSGAEIASLQYKHYILVEPVPSVTQPQLIIELCTFGTGIKEFDCVFMALVWNEKSIVLAKQQIEQRDWHLYKSTTCKWFVSYRNSKLDKATTEKMPMGRMIDKKKTKRVFLKYSPRECYQLVLLPSGSVPRCPFNENVKGLLSWYTLPIFPLPISKKPRQIHSVGFRLR